VGQAPGTPFAESHARTTTGENVVSLGLGGEVALPPTIVRRLTQVAVSGTVREAGGEPARGVEVSAVMFGEHGRLYPVFPVKTDSDGRYQLGLWEGERYRMRVGPRVGANAEMEFVATARALSITLPGR
jgi:hypothetical protein